MKNPLRLSLKPNERIWLNGAVIRVDRKVTIELMNDVQFLLEGHVIQPGEADTPLRQLYFILQMMIMNPTSAADARTMFSNSLTLLLASFTNPQILATLKEVDGLVAQGQVYDALKRIRSLYKIEADILKSDADEEPAPATLASARM